MPVVNYENGLEMSIDSNSSEPVYLQIADHVRRAIAAGVYRPGEMIPSLRTLALELHVNPNTVQRAFEALEREGLVHARKGLGMFVTNQGLASAREQSTARMHELFVRGVQTGREAGLPNEVIRGAFERAVDNVDTIASAPR